MTDFGGVLRKALEKLPRDSGAARREIYARARIALLKELRAVNPPVHAREMPDIACSSRTASNRSKRKS